EMDNPDNRGQSCETSEVTEERKEVEQFPDLPNTEAGEVALQKMEMGEVTKRSWAAVLKDQSCRIREKVEEEVKDPEEGSDLKQTEAVEVKDPEEGSDLKQTEALEVKDPEEGSDLKQTEAAEGEVKDPEEGQTPVEGRVPEDFLLLQGFSLLLAKAEREREEEEDRRGKSDSGPAVTFVVAKQRRERAQDPSENKDGADVEERSKMGNCTD
ncbi:hypothetical protein KUCAC02_023298, partial [Chaenocephalus aceratus]